VAASFYVDNGHVSEALNSKGEHFRYEISVSLAQVSFGVVAAGVDDVVFGEEEGMGDTTGNFRDIATEVLDHGEGGDHLDVFLAQLAVGVVT